MMSTHGKPSANKIVYRGRLAKGLLAANKRSHHHRARESANRSTRTNGSLALRQNAPDRYLLSKHRRIPAPDPFVGNDPIFTLEDASIIEDMVHKMHDCHKNIVFYRGTIEYLLHYCEGLSKCELDTADRRHVQLWFRLILSALEEWSSYRSYLHGLVNWKTMQNELNDLFHAQPSCVYQYSCSSRSWIVVSGRGNTINFVLWQEVDGVMEWNLLSEVIGTGHHFSDILKLKVEDQLHELKELSSNSAQNFADLLDKVISLVDHCYNNSKIPYNTWKISDKMYYGPFVYARHDSPTFNEDSDLVLAKLNSTTLAVHESPKAFRDQCELTLEKVCGRKGLLPDTYYLSAGSLTKVSTFPKSCGGFADVYNGQYDGRSVALKALRVYGKEQIRKTTKRFCKEVIYWKRLSHANIVPFLGVADAKMFPLCMVSSWMPHGNLAAYLKNKPTSNRIDLLLDVVKGLDYLHEQGVVHGDLKSANILIDDSYRARLADFGLATLNSPSCSTTSKSLCGSVRWMAPELLYPERTGRDSSRVSVMSDVYALAMVILEIFSDNVPFHDKSEAGVVIAITLGIKPEHPGADAVALGLTSDIWELMERCWQIDWRRRPSLREILSCIEKKRLSFPSDVLPSEIEAAELINHVFHCNIEMPCGQRNPPDSLSPSDESMLSGILMETPHSHIESEHSPSTNSKTRLKLDDRFITALGIRERLE